MHIGPSENKHNCQLCKKEFLCRCHGKYYGKDVWTDNEPCDEYEFGGSEERLMEIEVGKTTDNLERTQVIEILKNEINYAKQHGGDAQAEALSKALFSFVRIDKLKEESKKKKKLISNIEDALLSK